MGTSITASTSAKADYGRRLEFSLERGCGMCHREGAFFAAVRNFAVPVASGEISRSLRTEWTFSDSKRIMLAPYEPPEIAPAGGRAWPAGQPCACFRVRPGLVRVRPRSAAHHRLQ